MDNLRVMITSKETAQVRRIATDVYKKYCPAREAGQITQEDLYHMGIIGLIETKRRYDKSKGVPWPAFAAYRIRGAMLDQIRRQPMIRLPQERQVAVKQLKEAKNEIARSGNTADPETLAKKLGWVVEKVHDVLALTPSVESINTTGGKEDDEYRSVILSGQEPGPETAALKNELADLVNKCLESLPSSNDRLVLVARILEGLTLREVADTLGCSKENVRQLQIKAVKQMKRCIKRHGWNFKELKKFVK